MSDICPAVMGCDFEPATGFGFYLQMEDYKFHFQNLSEEVYDTFHKPPGLL